MNILPLFLYILHEVDFSNLTISDVPQHATFVFSPFVQDIAKNIHRISSIKHPI